MDPILTVFDYVLMTTHSFVIVTLACFDFFGLGMSELASGHGIKMGGCG
jgi:hypothetical protein